MKSLTQVEFEELGVGPHDAREVGLPPSVSTEFRVQVWMPDIYGWETCTAFGRGWQLFRSESEVCRFDKYPFWHKLPPDIKEP